MQKPSLDPKRNPSPIHSPFTSWGTQSEGGPVSFQTQVIKCKCSAESCKCVLVATKMDDKIYMVIGTEERAITAVLSEDDLNLIVRIFDAGN